MARKESFRKEELVEKGLQFINEKGIESLNARDLTKFIGCSTQPIFRNYENMQEYKKDLKKCMREDYTNFINNHIKKEDYLLTISYAYALYAKNRPNIFKALFITELAGSRTVNEVINTKRNKETINAMTKQYNLAQKEAEDLYRDVRFYTHGIACQICAKSIILKDKEIYELIKNIIKKLLQN